MWDCCCESVKKIEKSVGSGCILAHCMGLGKTLQVRRGESCIKITLKLCNILGGGHYVEKMRILGICIYPPQIIGYIKTVYYKTVSDCFQVLVQTSN